MRMNQTLRDEEQSGAEWILGINTDIRELAAHEQFVLLHNQTPIAVLANIVGGIVLFTGLSQAIPRESLTLWFAVLVLFNLTRYVLDSRLLAPTFSPEKIVRGRRYYLLVVFGSGLIWGAAGLLYFLPEQIEYEIFLALVLIGITAGSTALLSFHRFAFPLFMVPAIAPLGVQLLLNGSGLIVLVVGLSLPVYFIILTLLSHQIYNISQQSIVGQIEQKRLAHIDHLTNMPNRRAFETYLNEEWRRGTRHHNPLSLIIADIDDFKHFNDHFGHAAGDQVLMALSNFLQRQVRRAADMAARIGGEEFAVILPSTPLEKARDLALTMRERLRTDLPGDINRQLGAITLSFGVASCMPTVDGSLNELIECADRALYDAKHKGKDRVEVSAPESCSIERRSTVTPLRPV